MATFKLSIEDVTSKPEAFLYVFASDDLLKRLGSRSATIIRQKRANQNKVLGQSAKNADRDVKDYHEAIHSGFIDIYGITPAEALVRLAKGETVAGKNWSKGVYGVGSLYNVGFSQNAQITVDAQTGKILVNGVAASEQTPIVGTTKFPNNVQGYSYKDADGNTYISQYRTIKKSYYAGTYADKEGNKQDSSGNGISSADSASIWENVLSIIDLFVNWLVSLFYGTSGANLINKDNTLPSQTDGFVTQEAGFGTVGAILLASVAAGALLMGDKKKK